MPQKIRRLKNLPNCVNLTTPSEGRTRRKEHPAKEETKGGSGRRTLVLIQNETAMLRGECHSTGDGAKRELKGGGMHLKREID